MAQRRASLAAAAVMCLLVLQFVLVPIHAAHAAGPSKAAGSSPAVRRMEEDHPWIRWGGSWTMTTVPGASGRSVRTSRSAKAWASMKFKGTSAGIVSPTGPDMGRMSVYLDGKAVATVSLNTTQTANNVRVWRKTGLRNKEHTLKAIVTGTKGSGSTGTHVSIDAFETGGSFVKPSGAYPGVRVENGDPRLYKKGSWKTAKRKAAYGDSVMRTTKKGSSVTLRFKGTGVTWWGRKGPKLGESEVWLDGKKVATVSQYRSKAAEPRVVWAARSLKNKTHTLTIKSAHAPSVEGGGKETELDAFQVQGTVLTAPQPSPFKYKWKNYIVIDKSEFRLYLVKNKKLVRVFPIAHGKQGWATPERVWRIDAKYHSAPKSVYGPRKMRLFKRVKTSQGNRYVHSNYLIHGTNQEWVIGTRASHGCIRMYNKDVKELYPLVPMGTIVVTRN